MNSSVTRVLEAKPNRAINPICKAASFLRADIWRRFGALKNYGLGRYDLAKKVRALDCYKNLHLDGTIKNATSQDIVDNILMYKAASKELVKKDIFKRTEDKAEQKRLFTLLKRDEWLKDGYLHRRMRKHFRHGKAHCDNQFLVRSDRHLEEIIDGKLCIIIKVAKQYGDDITLVTSSSGKNVDLKGCNLRIIKKEDRIEIHYASEKEAGRPCGNLEIGVDKGYSEAFTDSEGEFHGEEFGKVMTQYSDAVSKTGKNKNKLYALEKQYREAGKTKKADRIRRHNLGTKKANKRKERTRRKLRTIAFKVAHAIVDKANVVASEDLSSVIASKHQWKRFNRRMSGWAKGVLAEALSAVCKQREAAHILVNGAYTSQMDSKTGLLTGKRVGDKFYRENGDVIQADYNAALNVKARLYDKDISLFTPYQKVKQILLSRSSDGTDRHGLELDDFSFQPSAEQSLKLMGNFA